MTQSELNEQNRKLQKLQTRFEAAKSEVEKTMEKVERLNNGTLESINLEKEKKIHNLQVTVSVFKSPKPFLV